MRAASTNPARLPIACAAAPRCWRGGHGRADTLAHRLRPFTGSSRGAGRLHDRWPAARGVGRGQVTHLDRNVFYVECPGFDAVEALQERDDWCWAACVEMARRYEGEEVTQREIVASIIDSPDVDQSAWFRHIIFALAPESAPPWKASLMQDFQIAPFTLLDREAYLSSLSSDHIIWSLPAGLPPIIGLRTGETHHVVVAVGAQYTRAQLSSTEELMLSSPDGRLSHFVRTYGIIWRDVFDPAIGRRRLGADELANVEFIMTRPDARAIVQNWAAGLTLKS